MPELLLRQAGRVGDKWRPLLAIAALAGSGWPALAQKAAFEDVEAEGVPDLVERLLVSIHGAFASAEKEDRNDIDNHSRLTTPALLGKLLTDSDEEWATANRGKPINAYYLRTKLRGLVDPRGTQDWYTGPKGRQVHHSGYLRLQFEDAWRRYIPSVWATSIFSSTHPESSGVSGVSGVAEQKPQTSAVFSPPDEMGGDSHRVEIQTDQVDQKPRETAAYSEVTPDTPDTPDHVEGLEEKEVPASKLNGELPGNTTNGSSRDDIIRQCIAQYPGKSINWYAKKLGQSPGLIRQVRGSQP